MRSRYDGSLMALHQQYMDNLLVTCDHFFELGEDRCCCQTRETSARIWSPGSVRVRHDVESKIIVTLSMFRESELDTRCITK